MKILWGTESGLSIRQSRVVIGDISDFLALNGTGPGT